MRRLWRVPVGVLLLAWASASTAFETTGARLVHGALEIQTQITHPVTGALSLSGIAWNTAFAQAAASWNASPSDLVAVSVNTGVYEDPCGPDPVPGEPGLHGVDFGPDWCDAEFGSATLAVARTVSTSGGLLLHANIVFDQAKNFDVFSGPVTAHRVDFRRIAVHEIGHLLGLGHSLHPPAIMEASTGSIEQPQPDDREGIASVYAMGCPHFSSSTGEPIEAALDVSDCFDTEVGLPLPSLNVGEEPDAFVDLYPVEATGEPLRFTLSSPEPAVGGFNPVLMLVDDSLSNAVALAFESATTRLEVNPPPGRYTLVVRGVFEGEGGPYTLTGVPAVPEPTAAALAATAVATLAGLARLRRRRVRPSGEIAAATAYQRGRLFG